ncbi:response regulator [Enterococcus faecalis]|nr:response regulator [Enterococcus faecalis]
MEEMDGIDSNKSDLERLARSQDYYCDEFIDDEKSVPAIESWCSGYLLKTSTAHEIADAIRDLSRRACVGTEVTHKMMERLTKKKTRAGVARRFDKPGTRIF